MRIHVHSKVSPRMTVIPGEFSVFTAVACLLTAAPLTARAAGNAPPGPPRSARYEDLLSFFREWRSFQRPKLVDGVPDYSAGAMAAHLRELETWRRRLAAIDASGWTVAQQVDYHVVRAEIAGLDFDHRVLKPWANNPAFYVTVFTEESDQPAREGPFAWGAVELWTWQFPLTPERADRAVGMDAGIRAIPRLLAQAKTNLTGSGRDLWIYGAKSIRRQSADLSDLATKMSGAPAGLKADVEKARQATDDFAAWLDSQGASRTGPSGIGVENYNWYLKNVQLVPSTWREEVAIMERELARSQALLAMEEQRNNRLPQPVPVASAEEASPRVTATGREELMMQAGMFDTRPRSRELVYILVAERAARALGELRMHSNEMTLEQACAFACANTPRGWLRMDGNLVRSEQHLYLQQPGYGTSYLIGKIEIEKLLSARKQQLGESFTVKRFMSEFNAAGLIPASLPRFFNSPAFHIAVV